MKITQKDYSIHDQVLTNGWHHGTVKPKIQRAKSWYASLSAGTWKRHRKWQSHNDAYQ